MRLRHYILLLLVVSCFTASTYGRFIAMDTTSEYSIVSNTVCIKLTSTNNGDEPAKKVRFESIRPDMAKSGKTFETVDIGETIEDQLDMALPKNDHRQLLMPIKTHYHDANLYPFSSLSHIEVNPSDPPGSTIHATFEPLTFNDEGVLIMKIRSVDGQKHELGINLISPNELSITPLEQNVVITPADEETISFKVKNFSALPNSTYILLAVSSEQTPGGIIEEGFTTQIRVERVQESLWGKWGKAAITACIILFLVFLYLQLPKGRRNRRS